MANTSDVGRRLFAEFLGTAILVAGVVGSGIMAQRLSPNDVGLQLLENAIATGGILFILIATLGPVSGAQFNPVVTAADAWFGGLAKRDVLPYLVAQVGGACAGAILANLMFGLTAVNISTHVRDGSSTLLSEVVATFGLLLVIFGLVAADRHGFPLPSRPTSWAPTGSRRRRRSRTQPSQLAARCQIRSLELHR